MIGEEAIITRPRLHKWLSDNVCPKAYGPVCYVFFIQVEEAMKFAESIP